MCVFFRVVFLCDRSLVTAGKGLFLLTCVLYLFVSLLVRLRESGAVPPPLLTFTWPHLRCDVGLEEGEY